MHRQFTMETPASPDRSLNFLWLELTNSCNLQCVHCYSSSAPSSGKSKDVMACADYKRAIESAASLGCRALQFIGGEPTLNPDLPHLIAHARDFDFEFVEVFTNAMRVSEQVFQSFVEHRVAVATSVYSHSPAVHDFITQHPGSHAKTMRNIQRFLEAGLDVRAGVIEMDQNRAHVAETIKFLSSLGVRVGTDRARAVGRGVAIAIDPRVPGSRSSVGDVCGSCWRGSLCISPAAEIFLCIMNRDCPVGSFFEQDLGQVLTSRALLEARQTVFDDVWVNLDNSSADGRSYGCNPRCSPSCPPCYPWGKCDPQITPCRPYPPR